MNSNIDLLWKYITNSFESNVLVHLPHHTHIFNQLQHVLSTEMIAGTPNILLYGAPGFPVDILINMVLIKKHGMLNRNNVLWNNKIHYTETAYFFECDMADPHNPNDTDIFVDFINDIVLHPCVHSGRHLIILKHAERMHSQDSNYSFRKLLERFSNNALFICTTNKVGAIEHPLRSRCYEIRIPLATPKELELILGADGLDIGFHPLLIKHHCRDFYFAVYIAWLQANTPELVTEELCKYNIVPIQEFLKSKKNISMEDIRLFVAKISVHDVSIADITFDILHHIIGSSKKNEFLCNAANIDHMCATTEGHRKPLYMELLFNIAVFGIKPI